MQLNHYNSKFKKRNFPITVICENISNAPNIGSMFRIADAFGIENMIFCGNDIVIGRKMTKTSRATEKYVNHEIRSSALSVITELKQKDYLIIALEITKNSTPINEIEFSINQPLALIVGDENFGIPQELLNLADEIIHIEMFGQNSSMNVVQATNIVLYEMTKQLNV